MRPGEQRQVSRDERRNPARRALGQTKTAYPEYLTGTEAGAAIEPVIIPQFVDLDPFATVGRL